jgi:hypothetical protein
MPPLPSRLASSATLLTLTVGFTSSCGLPEERCTLRAESRLSVSANGFQLGLVLFPGNMSA